MADKEKNGGFYEKPKISGKQRNIGYPGAQQSENKGGTVVKVSSESAANGDKTGSRA